MSAVWNFFTKQGTNESICNICGKSYKTSGNTSNLAAHLKQKHMHAFLELEKLQNQSKSKTVKTPSKTAHLASRSSSIDSTNVLVLEDATDDSVSNLTVPSCSKADLAQEHQEGTNSEDSESEPLTKKPRLIRKQTTLIACLEQSASFDEGGEKHNSINQALVYMICKDNLPYSCVEKQGMARFACAACPLYKLPSRKKVTQLIENRYATTKAVLKKKLSNASFFLCTSDILTITNSTRSFLVLTVHMIDPVQGLLQSISLSAQRLVQGHTGEYIQESWTAMFEEFGLDKAKVVCFTTDNGSNIVCAVRLFLGEGHRIPCMAHALHLIVDSALSANNSFSALCYHVKIIVTYFKQSVNAMDLLREEQDISGKKEGEVLTLTQAVNTRWNSCLEMLEKFLLLSAIVAKVLAVRSQSNKKTPDMVPTSQLNVIRDITVLLCPFKQATEEISGSSYVTSSLAIPITNLLKQAIDQTKPASDSVHKIKQALDKGIGSRLAPLENNKFLAAATILDPRFERIHFQSPHAVSAAIKHLSNEIRTEHRNRGKRSPEIRSLPVINENKNETSIWARHEKLMSETSSTQEIPTTGSVPNELKQYLDQPLLDRKSDPVQFWLNSRHFTPVLSEIALK